MNAEMLRSVRPLVEGVVRALSHVQGPMDRPAISDRLRRVVQLAYLATDTDPTLPAHAEAIREASAVVREVSALVERDGKDTTSALEALREVRERLERTLDSVALDPNLRRLRPMASGPQPFRASVGEPQLHALPRGRFAPPLIIGTPEDAPDSEKKEAPKKPTTFEELRAFAATHRVAKEAEPPPEPPPEPARPWAESIDEGEAQRTIARDLLEDIGSLSLLRVPGEGESWLAQSAFEQRMLDALDAFASFGGVVLPMVTLYHAEAPSPDPARAFAVAFVLGCVQGSDTVDVAIATLRGAPIEEYPGFLEGFALASNPAIDSAASELLGHTRPAIAKLAVELLDRRGTFPEGWIESLFARSDIALAAAALRVLARSGSRLDAIAVAEPWAHPDAPPEIFAAACETLLRRGHSRARDILRSQLEGPHALVAQSLFCIAAPPGDAPYLCELALRAPSLALVSGLGRYGHVSTIDPLIRLVGHEDEALGLAAAWSLERITGAGLFEIVEEPWDAARANDPAFAGKPVPMRKVKKPVRDVEAWRSWQRDRGKALDPLRKYRGGKLFQPSMIVDELEAESTPASARTEALREFRIATGSDTRFSTSDWVSRQRALLPILRDDARKTHGDAGAWFFAGGGTLGTAIRR
jgi:hypothetical protein